MRLTTSKPLDSTPQTLNHIILVFGCRENEEKERELQMSDCWSCNYLGPEKTKKSTRLTPLCLL